MLERLGGSSPSPRDVLQFKSRHAPRLRQPTKPRANIIPCYAPILASPLLSVFALDGVAKPLKGKPHISRLGLEVVFNSVLDQDDAIRIIRLRQHAQRFNEIPKPIHFG
jgi:hypothetical protein